MGNKIAKPPMGIIPRDIYEERELSKRADDILAAIKRYITAREDIPGGWIKELTDIAWDLSERADKQNGI